MREGVEERVARALDEPAWRRDDMPLRQAQSLLDAKRAVSAYREFEASRDALYQALLEFYDAIMAEWSAPTPQRAHRAARASDRVHALRYPTPTAPEADDDAR